jgi:glycosyltransferase involved in cell wall biosynthesis
MGGGMRPDYSIVVPAYDEEDLLPATLSALRRAMGALPQFRGEIVVTDNDSHDRTAEIAADAGARVVFEEHRQIARARNVGGHYAEGDYLIFVDADTQVSAALLRATLEALASGEICGGGTVVGIDREVPGWVRRVVGFWTFLSRRLRWACGAYVFCLRSAFLDSGGFDERYYASEEIHFSRALKRWGRARGLDFVILNEPISTSLRKMEWYSPSELLRLTVCTLLSPGRMRRRDGCELWYNRPQAKPERPV